MSGGEVARISPGSSRRSRLIWVVLLASPMGGLRGTFSADVQLCVQPADGAGHPVEDLFQDWSRRREVQPDGGLSPRSEIAAQPQGHPRLLEEELLGTGGGQVQPAAV